MKSREISRSKIEPFPLACTDPYTGIGWEYQSSRSGIERNDKSPNCLVTRCTTVMSVVKEVDSFLWKLLFWHPRDLQVSVATGCFCRVLIFVSS